MIQKQNRLYEHATAATVLGVTILILCVENAKSLALQTSSLSYRALINENSLAIVASGASSLVRRVSLINDSQFRLAALHPCFRTSTSLSMAWSMPSPPSFQTTSLNAFGSWYEVNDPRAGPPIYEDRSLDYSFSAPADDWPSMDLSEESEGNMSVPANEGNAIWPLRTIRRAAGVVAGLPRLVARSF